jgi:hypothetical protein
MDQSWVLIDTNTGLHVGWYFWLRVLDEVNRATRYGAPFGLPARVAGDGLSHIPAAIRATDLGGVLGSHRAGVLLPHQDYDAARTAKARILERIARSCPACIRWESTLFAYPEDAADVSNLLTGGWIELGQPGQQVEGVA